MINYHSDVVLRIDMVLMALFIAFSVMLIAYAIIRDYRAQARAKKLSRIKQVLATIFLSGKTTPAALALIKASTTEQFIDVVTNRRKHGVFFNESEQQLFKENFITADRVKRLRSVAMRRGSGWRKVEAIAALGYAQVDGALDILEKSLYSKNEDVSYFSSLAIGQISTMGSVAILMNFLKAKPPLRRKIASILENLSPNITDEVIKFADDEDANVRVWAVRLLSRSVSKEYIAKVESMTQDPSPDVRAAACISLAKLNDRHSKELLFKCLKDDTWFVRMHAVRALSRIFGKESIKRIIEMLNDGSLLVIDSVRQAMVDDIDSAMPYIQKILEGDDELAKKICKMALEDAGLKVKDKKGRL